MWLEVLVMTLGHSKKGSNGTAFEEQSHDCGDLITRLTPEEDHWTNADVDGSLRCRIGTAQAHLTTETYAWCQKKGGVGVDVDVGSFGVGVGDR